MTISSLVFSLHPKYWFIGSTAFLFFLVCVQRHHSSNAFPTPPTQLVEDHEEVIKSQYIWAEGMIRDIEWWLDCHVHMTELVDVHNQTIWNTLKQTYFDVVHQDLDAAPPASGLDRHDFKVPVEIKQTKRISKRSGREYHELAVFAKERIPKGTLVWESTHTAEFETGSQYRSFLKHLPDHLACHILDWSYPRYHGDHPVLCVDLDHGSQLHTCDPGTEECNLHLNHHFEDPNAGCDIEFHASRDIEAGEELMMDHDFEKDHHAFEHLGLHDHSDWPEPDREHQHDEHHDGLHDEHHLHEAYGDEADEQEF